MSQYPALIKYSLKGFPSYNMLPSSVATAKNPNQVKNPTINESAIVEATEYFIVWAKTHEIISVAIKLTINKTGMLFPSPSSL